MKRNAVRVSWAGFCSESLVIALALLAAAAQARPAFGVVDHAEKPSEN